MKKENISTKDKIILTTIELIGEAGLQNATAGNISKVGGFTKSNIFYYFETIDQVLLKALLKSIEGVSPILGSDFHLYKSISHYLNSSIEGLLSSKEKILYLKVIFSFAYQSMYLEDVLKDLHIVIIEDLYHVLIDALDYFKKRDLEKEEVESLASLIMASFNGLGVILLIDSSDKKFIDTWRFQVELIENHII